MDILLYKIALKPIGFITLFLLASSCGMGSEEQCTSRTILSDLTKFDTLVIGQPKRNSVYAAKIWMKGKITDTTELRIDKVKEIQLSPGEYDSLIYQGDWYADPMVLELKGGSGSSLEFCATFFY